MQPELRPAEVEGHSHRPLTEAEASALRHEGLQLLSSASPRQRNRGLSLLRAASEGGAGTAAGDPPLSAPSAPHSTPPPGSASPGLGGSRAAYQETPESVLRCEGLEMLKAASPRRRMRGLSLLRAADGSRMQRPPSELGEEVTSAVKNRALELLRVMSPRSQQRGLTLLRIAEL